MSGSKIISSLIVLSMLAVVFSSFVLFVPTDDAADDSSVMQSDDVLLGSVGSIPNNAIPISSPADLSRVGTGVLYGGYIWSPSSHYYLDQDIQWPSNVYWTPIGTQGSQFTGVFDGNGHAIHDLKMNTVSSPYVYGLFGFTSGAEVKNLMLDGLDFVHNTASTYHMGGIVAVANSGTVIRECAVYGSILAKDNTASSSSVSAVGGLVGYANGGVYHQEVYIENCYNGANLQASGSDNWIDGGNANKRAGGIVGIANGTVILNCYNIGKITSVRSGHVFLGGILGESQSLSSVFTMPNSIVNCYSTNPSGGSVSDIVGRYSSSSVLFDGVSDPVRLLNQYSGVYVSSSMRVLFANGHDGFSTYYTGLTDSYGHVERSGWDFEDVWTLSDVYHDYPRLQCFSFVHNFQSDPVLVVASGDFYEYSISTPFNDGSSFRIGSFLRFVGPSWLSLTGNILSGVAPVPSDNVSESFEVSLSLVIPGSATIWQSFVLTVSVTTQISILNVPLTLDAYTGRTDWSFTPLTDISGASISLIGPSWLRSNGTSIIVVSGGVPFPSLGASSETFEVQVVASKLGYVSGSIEFYITVYRDSSFTSSPVASLSVTRQSDGIFHVDATGSSNYTAMRIDLGDGSPAVLGKDDFDYHFVNGVYDVLLTVENPIDSATDSVRVFAYVDEPVTDADFGIQYVCVLMVSLGGNVPSLSGASWLSVTSFNDGVSDYVVISGKTTNSLHVIPPNDVFNMDLAIGSQHITWDITVHKSEGWPHAGFDVFVSGLRVVVVSSAFNSFSVSYWLFDGDVERVFLPEFTWVYDSSFANTTVVIRQLVTANVSGQMVTSEFSTDVHLGSADEGFGNEDSSEDEGFRNLLLSLVIVGGILAVLIGFFMWADFNRERIFLIVFVLVGLIFVLLFLRTLAVIL